MEVIKAIAATVAPYAAIIVLTRLVPAIFPNLGEIVRRIIE